MTLSDLWHGYQGLDIFDVEYLRDKVSIAYIAHYHETIRNLCNGTMFGDLEWLLNASRGLTAIAEFFVYTRYTRSIYGVQDVNVEAYRPSPRNEFLEAAPKDPTLKAKPRHRTCEWATQTLKLLTINQKCYLRYRKGFNCSSSSVTTVDLRCDCK